MNTHPNLYDKLFLCMYVLMRRIKKERENIGIAANFLGICSALNVNTVIGSLILYFGNSPNWKNVIGILMGIPGIFFFYFPQRYFLFSGLATRMISKLEIDERLPIEKMWIAILYSFLSIFLFWGILLFIHWLRWGTF